MAIYTRKSGDENMNGAVTSIDSQKAACRGYIRIQKERGWQEYPEAFDDPAESGKSLDRPAVKCLLKAVREGRVQAVIAYKLDRLTRSSRDFHQLVELFEKHNVGLVSATESIDTKSPQGRLMTYIMVQFAQYDRELDQERSKDFHLARARKGLWCGGLPPLGYDCKDKQLAVNEEEAGLVRRIFELYLRLVSAERVAGELNCSGLRRKLYRTQAGRLFGGQAFDDDSVIRILRRKAYVGRIVNSRTGLESPGQHRAIVAPEVFGQAQRLLDEQARHEREEYGVNRNGFLLKGLAKCGLCGGPLAGCCRPKRSKVYRYYLCQAAAGPCGFRSIIAERLEEMVVRKLEESGRDRPFLEGLVLAAAKRAKETAVSLEEEKRGLEVGLARAGRDLGNLRQLLEINPGIEAAVQEIRKLELLESEAHASERSLRGRISRLRAMPCDVDAAQEALHGFGSLLEGLPVWRRIEAVRALVRRVRVWKDRVELDLDEFALADIKRRLAQVPDSAAP
ncbi:MAG: recombinase family protein [Elusimicrobia bacterium]|nr:recombinase family protein [Elusimicrobiota bacterium]